MNGTGWYTPAYLFNFIDTSMNITTGTSLPALPYCVSRDHYILNKQNSRRSPTTCWHSAKQSRIRYSSHCCCCCWATLSIGFRGWLLLLAMGCCLPSSATRERERERA